MAKKVKPITPHEVAAKKQTQIPSEVFEAFNELIAKSFNGTSATVYQKDAAALIASKLNCHLDTIYSNHWLDVEDSYRKYGWKVEYDKPGYNENYDAYFKFIKSTGGYSNECFDR